MAYADDSLQNTAITLLQIVSNIPYGNVGVRSEQETARGNAGSCSSKHLLLASLFSAVGLEVKFFMGAVDLALFNKSLETPINLPGECWDFHNFLEVKIGGAWRKVDATFGVSESKYGLPNNLDWNAKRNCRILFPVQEIWEVEDLVEEKERKLASLSPEMQENRDIFFSRFLLMLKRE